MVSLLDLKNAFGEVHHKLIPAILAYHHIPSEIQSLISSLYLDFKTCIITDKFQTPAIPVRRGVLQGDCLSPLLFNLCFNTFIQYIKSDKYKQLGLSPMTVMTACLSQYTGFSLLMMLLLLPVEKKKTRCSA